MALPAGTKVGPYEIVTPLGAGGMGEVYKAHDPRLRRDVAIKVSAAQFTERFEREAHAIAALNHSHICQVYDVGPNYLVMEYIKGDPLKGPLPLEKVLEYAGQIASALETAHEKDITHRDLKPANILVTPTGAKLLDFGLASIAVATSHDDATQAMSLTGVGMVMGTAAYMSPEQARGEEVDARSDIFSFGAVLYEMLSGRRAFSRGSLVETMSAVLRDEPAALDAPTNVSGIVTRCLRKSRADRFQTMGEVRAALELAAAKPAETQPSIAILPFANMSADKENEYFSDGLTEEILNLLARIPGLKVVARTSSFAFRGKEQDITRIAEALRVQTILEGSVRKAGNRVRISAQLIQASDGTHLWSERYDRDMTDVFAIQDEISQAISEALQVRLAPRAKVVNVEAWQHCLKGEFHRQRFTPDSMAKAKEHFEQALAIDPAYAHAYNCLAMYYYARYWVSNVPAAEMAPLAKEAATRALALDPANTEPQTVLAVMAAAFDHDWKAAENHLRKAMAMEPVTPRARYCFYGYFLLPQGRVSEGMVQARLALEGDPLSPLLHFGVAFCAYCDGQYSEAIAFAGRGLEIDANAYAVRHVMGLAQLASGLTQEAIVNLTQIAELAPWYQMGVGSLAAAYHLAGDREREKAWERKLTASHRGTFGAAFYYALTGEADAMFEALDGAYRQRDLFLLYLRNFPSFEPYRADARFQALLMKMNLA